MHALALIFLVGVAAVVAMGLFPGIRTIGSGESAEQVAEVQRELARGGMGVARLFVSGPGWGSRRVNVSL